MPLRALAIINDVLERNNIDGRKVEKTGRFENSFDFTFFFTVKS